jgi:hypothetical protein
MTSAMVAPLARVARAWPALDAVGADVRGRQADLITAPTTENADAAGWFDAGKIATSPITRFFNRASCLEKRAVS